jgi:hypothetical protein
MSSAPSSSSNQNASPSGSSGKAKVSLPSDKTMQQAVKLSIKTSKPICMYFYIDSLKGKVTISSDGEDKIVFKNEDEYTSPILNTYQCENCYIIVTENTIYLVSSNTRIS